MSKGVSQVISIILILMISVALVGALYAWTRGIDFDMFPQGSTDTSYLRSRACLNIENANMTSGEIVVKNCGKVMLSNITVYLDSLPVQIESVTNETIAPQALVAITVDFGTATETNIVVSSDYAQTPPVKANI